ncbi:MAG: AAA family ATPase [Methylophaga sp.]|nr:AAA family ATPase [Methylophaga sp.]
MNTQSMAKKVLEAIQSDFNKLIPEQRKRHTYIAANDDDIDKWWPEHRLEEVRIALQFLDADDRDIWIKAGMALKAWAGSDGLKLWNDWSKNSNKYKAEEIPKVWGSFQPESVDIGTVFHLAQEDLNALLPSHLSREEMKAFVEEYELNNCPQLLSIVHAAVVPLQKQDGFALIPANELTAVPHKPDWLIRDMFEKDTLINVFGPPASYKSFMALDMAFCIANGINWHGKEVSSGAVVYIAGEGRAGLGRRLKALENYYGTETNQLFTSTGSAELMSADNIQEVMDAINAICPDPKLVIFDTLHRNMGEGDENSASDMAKLLKNIDALRYTTGAAIMLVHHTGHSDTGRARGSSSIRAAMDVEYTIKKNGSSLELSCTKSKDNDEPMGMHFAVKQIDTGWIDENGVSISSLVLELASGDDGIKLSEYEQSALNILTFLVGSSVGTVVTLETWRLHCFQQWEVEEHKPNRDTLKKRFLRSRKALEEKGHIELKEGEVLVKENK